ncbi:TldD/PmbA family protein [Clostridia bacterium]|nr:TldD/PmbA family protein [Clostridia bacterium]
MLEQGKKALELAISQSDEAEIYISSSRELSIEVHDAKVETLKQAESKGLGIRVFLNSNMGFAFTSDLSEDSIQRTVEKAVKNAHYTQGDEFSGLPSKSHKDYPVIHYDETIENTTVEDKIALALAGEKAAKEKDKRIDKIEACGYEDVISTEIILSSKGVEIVNKACYCGLYVSLIAQENEDVQTGFAMDFKRNYNELDAVACGHRAAEKALEMLGAKTITTEKIPLLFDPYTTTNLLGVLASSFSGENVMKGKSMLKGKLGDMVMADCIQIVDDATLKNGVMSSPSDGEGMPSQRTVLVHQGKLETFLHNTYTARRMDTVSTGNAARGGYSTGIGVGSTNLYIEAGKASPEELIASVKRGLLVTGLLGVHTANPISGDFSIGAAGMLIEDGKKTNPVRGVVISGNLLSLFKNVEALGNDLTFFAGKGAPSMLTGKITVSGN